MQIADDVSVRSPDPSTKHGCVIVDKNNRIVSTGYNGPIKGLNHSIVEFKRPQKYNWMIHAEDNAVLFAKCDLDGCTAYITGHPCVDCFRRLVQSGVKRICYGNRMSACVESDHFSVCHKICKDMKIEMINIY